MILICYNIYIYVNVYIYIYQWQDEITVAEMGLFRNLPDLETVDRGLVGCQLSAIVAWLSWSGDVAMCHASVATPKRYPGCQWSCKQRLNGSWVFLWSQVTGHRFIRTSLYSSHVPSQFVNHDPQPTSLNVMYSSYQASMAFASGDSYTMFSFDSWSCAGGIGKVCWRMCDLDLNQRPELLGFGAVMIWAQAKIWVEVGLGGL